MGQGLAMAVGTARAVITAALATDTVVARCSTFFRYRAPEEYARLARPLPVVRQAHPDAMIAATVETLATLAVRHASTDPELSADQLARAFERSLAIGEDSDLFEAVNAILSWARKAVKVAA